MRKFKQDVNVKGFHVYIYIYAKTKKTLSSLCPKKISIMNSPRRPLFSEIYMYI